MPAAWRTTGALEQESAGALCQGTGVPEFLSVADVIAIHARAMLVTGEPPAPLLDAGRLEGAVLRLRLAAYDERADVIRQAALLAAGLVQAHAFLDGLSGRS